MSEESNDRINCGNVDSFNDIDDDIKKKNNSSSISFDDDEEDNDLVDESRIFSPITSSISLADSSDKGSQQLWEFKVLAPSETLLEHEMFRMYLESVGSGGKNKGGVVGGRSLPSVAQLYNSSTDKVRAIAERNNWGDRADAYDRAVLLEQLKLEKDARALEHKRKLERYRASQEFLAKMATGNAAKILMLLQRKLDNVVNSDQGLRDDEIISYANLSVKIAELGKNLGSQALGVDALLEALEEGEAT